MMYGAFGLLCMLPMAKAIDTITSATMGLGYASFVSAAWGQTPALAKSQLQAIETYNKAHDDFKSILNQRRTQINSNRPLPDRPGQALYLARNSMISAYKDLTDAIPAKIGRPN